MTAERDIGKCKCPACGHPRASVRVSAKQLAYMVCNACNLQAFARSDRSDELIRSMIINEPQPEPQPKPQPVPKQEPQATPQPAAGMGWGVLGHV